jgi:hypothetical protein
VIGALFFTILTLAPFTVAATAFFANPLPERRVDRSGRSAAAGSRKRAFSRRSDGYRRRTPADGYPELSGRRFKAPPEAIEETILGSCRSARLEARLAARPHRRR